MDFLTNLIKKIKFTSINNKKDKNKIFWSPHYFFLKKICTRYVYLPLLIFQTQLDSFQYFTSLAMNYAIDAGFD